MTAKNWPLLAIACLLFIASPVCAQSGRARVALPTKPTLDLNLLLLELAQPYQLPNKDCLFQSLRESHYPTDRIINFGLFSLRAEVISRQPGEGRYVLRYDTPRLWFRWWNLRPTGRFGHETLSIFNQKLHYTVLNLGVTKRF